MNTDEKFEEFCKSLSCNGCQYFRENICTHENGIENEKGKFAIRKFMKKDSKEKYDHWMENENAYYICDQYTEIK